MNTCKKNKRRIAWMTTGVLDTTEVETLRRHFESCPTCRSYWQSLSALSEQLVNASNLPPAEPTESFHRTLVQKISTQKQTTLLFDWAATLRRLWLEQPMAKFSAGVALTFALVLALAALPWIHTFSRDEHHVSSGVQMISQTTERTAPRPTLASYHRAAGISLENLDALLTRQAFRASPASETLTVSSLLTSSSEN